MIARDCRLHYLVSAENDREKEAVVRLSASSVGINLRSDESGVVSERQPLLRLLISSLIDTTDDMRGVLAPTPEIGDKKFAFERRRFV